MQDIMEVFNKDWKKSNWNLGNEKLNITKTSKKSLANRMEQVENRVWGIENKVDEIDLSVKDTEKMLRE
jgi:hypothetical protein